MSELAGLRARLRQTLTGSGVVRHPDRDHWSEHLVLIADELTSNGLRHGRSPVHVRTTATGRGWFVDVIDAAVEQPPVPAVDRDPADGGLGLYLVARLCRVRGWTVEDDGKHVWACMQAA